MRDPADGARPEDETDAAEPGSGHAIALYAATGSHLVRYEVDVERAALTEREAVLLPENIQYVWPHPSRRYLYLACSNGAPGSLGERHCAVALRVAAGGILAVHGETIALHGRPVHITTDIVGRHALIAYNDPSAVTVHRIAGDGTLGEAVQQVNPPNAGIFAHQTRVLASDRTAILVTRGNDAVHDRPEDPGALKIFDYDDGRLSLRATIAPGGGYGYGPRHVDFHPSGRWLYVSLERQNRLHVHSVAGDAIDPAPAFVYETLADPAHVRPAQRAGTLHVHPGGRLLYVANRADGTALENGTTVFAGGENNIAVYAIDERTGALTLVQHIDTGGIVPRTFAIDPDGRMLVAANSKALPVKTPRGCIIRPAGLTLFDIAADGRLGYRRQYDMAIGSPTLFWVGMVALPSA